MNLKQPFAGLFSFLKFNAETKTESVYEKNRKLPQRIDSFVYHWNNSFNKTSTQISQLLKYSEFFGYGSSMSYILKLTGKPDFVLDNENYGIDILVYLIKVKGNEVRFELHFNEKQLFFINYTYLKIADMERENVLKALSEKYHIRIPHTELFDHILIDREGNGLVLENGEDLSVNFLSPSSQVERISRLYAMGKKTAI